MSNKNNFIKKDRFKSLEEAANRVSDKIIETKDELTEAVVSRFASVSDKVLNHNENLIVEIDKEKLIPAPQKWNFYDKLTDDKMLELVESIKTNGLMHPLVVWEQGDEYMILSGHNRKTAIDLIYEETNDDKYKKIPCNLKKSEEIDEDTAREIIIDTNWIQRQLTTVEKAKSISEKYIRLGRKKNTKDGIKTRDIIAQAYGMSGRMVQSYLSLNKLIEEIEGLLRENHINIKSAVAISKLSEDKQKWLYVTFTSRELSNKDITKITASMTKNEIVNILKTKNEYVNLNIKVPLDKKDAILELINNFINS